CQIVMLNSVSVILPPLLQWQWFAAILNLSRVKLAPVMLPVNIEQCAGVFSLQRHGYRGSSPRNIAPHRLASASRRCQPARQYRHELKTNNSQT
ncbi:hypothetical protein KQI90_22330, partial [Salmonella enterica subsp. enterica serovar Infantis]|nr:hypothetical protein [Salmonella enterica subsp. enterica serovar Infantis]